MGWPAGCVAALLVYLDGNRVINLSCSSINRRLDSGYVIGSPVLGSRLSALPKTARLTPALATETFAIIGLTVRATILPTALRATTAAPSGVTLALNALLGPSPMIPLHVETSPCEFTPTLASIVEV